MKLKSCELCNADAVVFCPSDAAFLCWSCDTEVHQANFIVARHIRQPVCSNFTISDAAFHPFSTTCLPTDELHSLSSSSSDCISSTTSPVKECSSNKRNSDAPSRGSASSVNHVTVEKCRRTGYSKARMDYHTTEGILLNWCGKLGLDRDLTVGMACNALKMCLDRSTLLPRRVCLAASVWLGLRLGREKSDQRWQVLRRLEEVSCVPAKLIFAAEPRMARALRGQRQHRRRLELQEGWAESAN